MRILPLVRSAQNSVYNNVRTTKNEFTKSQKEAKILAKRTANIYETNRYGKYLLAGKFRKLLKIITPVNLPIISGLIGLATPIPFAGVACATLGAIAGLGIHLHDKYTQKNHSDKLHKA